MKCLSVRIIICILCISNFLNVGAKTGNVVYNDKNIRITLISDKTMRLEYSQNGNFVDNKSFIAVNREYDDVDYTIKERKGWIEIKTNSLKLKYKKDSGKFSKDNLSITSLEKNFPIEWTPGLSQKNNLKGTCRTLTRPESLSKNSSSVAGAEP